MASTQLPSELLTLLDAANAEAKRAGQEKASAIHVAVALARRTPEVVDDVLGAGSAQQLRDRPLGEIAGGVVLASELLERAGSSDPRGLLKLVSQAVPNLRDWLAEANDSADRDNGHQRAESSLNERSSEFLALVEPDSTVLGREELVEELIALLTRRDPATALLAGPAGSGKTAVLRALAHRVARGDTPLGNSAVLRIGVDGLLSENPVQALDAALDAVRAEDIVLVVDDVEAALALGTGTVIGPMLTRLRAGVEDPNVRLILVVDERFAARLATVDEELAAELTRVDVTPLEAETLERLAALAAAQLAAHHKVSLDREVVWLAAAPRSRTDLRSHPGLLFDRLDTACARARLRADGRVLESDLGIACDPSVAPIDAGAVLSALRERVRGQDEALHRLAAHLALTRARLDLRPERPDGVFLLVGPTGVGKTELARALTAYLYGSEQRLIRLDMSEYAGEWALSRIVGPQPGYVGYTQPENWLTTRIIAQPDTVLLLDEIEKAHQGVWNAFLQVFDAGRLTDSRGNVADFSKTIVLLTSNLGADAFTPKHIGFATTRTETNSEETVAGVRGAVEDAMPPELINRLDGIIVFNPLSDDVLLEIVEAELLRLRERLHERGYRIEFEDGVAQFLAAAERDPRYGARHIQRNIERLLLEPLARLEARELTAKVEDNKIVWRDGIVRRPGTGHTASRRQEASSRSDVMEGRGST